MKVRKNDLNKCKGRSQKKTRTIQVEPTSREIRLTIVKTDQQISRSSTKEYKRSKHLCDGDPSSGSYLGLLQFVNVFIQLYFDWVSGYAIFLFCKIVSFISLFQFFYILCFPLYLHFGLLVFLFFSVVKLCFV